MKASTLSPANEIAAMSALGQKADISHCNRDVRFTPNSGLCGATRDVRCGIASFGDRVAELVHRDLRAGYTIQESLEVEACELVLRLLSQMRRKGSGGARIACF